LLIWIHLDIILSVQKVFAQWCWLHVLQILTAFAGVFHNLQPLKVPGFRSVLWTVQLIANANDKLFDNALISWTYIRVSGLSETEIYGLDTVAKIRILG
jgi:hypothetical protein